MSVEQGCFWLILSIWTGQNLMKAWTWILHRKQCQERVSKFWNTVVDFSGCICPIPSDPNCSIRYGDRIRKTPKTKYKSEMFRDYRVCMDEFMHSCMCGWMRVWMDVCMVRWMDEVRWRHKTSGSAFQLLTIFEYLKRKYPLASNMKTNNAA